MATSSRKDMDMTTGPLFVKILLFALPLILTNLLQMFYNAADMIVAGYSVEPDAVGAIGTTGAFTSLMLYLVIGMAAGATVVVARHIGAGARDRANVAAHTAAVVGLICGVVGGALGAALSKPIMTLMGNRGGLLDLSVTYLRIYFAGMPFHALSNYAIAVHRAKGDTRTPLVVLSATGVLNVLLNLFFVLVCKLSVEGVALATGIAAAVSAVVLYGSLMRDKGVCHFSFRRLCVDRAEVKQILLIGIPSGVQNAMFAISSMIIQSSVIRVNNLLCSPDAAYQPIVKGNAAATSLEGLLDAVTVAMGNAAATFTGQNIGAEKPERVGRVMTCCYALGAAMVVPLSVLLFVLRSPLLSLYGIRRVAGDPLAEAAYGAAVTAMIYMALAYVLEMTIEIGPGTLRGLGRSISSTCISLVGICVFRIGWIALVFPHFLTLEAIYVAYPISWTLTGITQFVFAVVTLRRLIREKRARALSPPDA